MNAPNVKRVILSGRYCNDLAERFSYAPLPPEKWEVIETIPGAADALKASGGGEIFVLTCFSDRDKFLTLTEREG